MKIDLESVKLMAFNLNSTQFNFKYLDKVLYFYCDSLISSRFIKYVECKSQNTCTYTYTGCKGKIKLLGTPPRCYVYDYRCNDRWNPVVLVFPMKPHIVNYIKIICALKK